EDGYSAFTLLDPETGENRPTGLGGYLAQLGVNAVVVVGLATDVCVKATALDAVSLGLKSTVLWDLTRAVELVEGDTDTALSELLEEGVEIEVTTR
ncbi:MAG TPA: isochorismatase family protein, partial [Microthrixaceae bacterium]|nr:isochorismatase family protein [Microthrixaceae bacterium]